MRTLQKPLKHSALLIAQILASLCFISPLANAAQDPRDFFVRTGLNMGSYSGQGVQGTYSTDVTLEGELWLYQTPMRALTLRAYWGNESKIARTRLFGVGLGQRFYISGSGVGVDSKVGEDILTLRSKWAPYAGWDFNLAQLLVVSFGSVLSSYSTVGSVGGVLGTRYAFSQSLFSDALIGYHYGTTISSPVSVTTTGYRLLLGVGFTF